ncbi:zinc finger MYM-type protein 6-like [Arctopsyche grandis]|uniref:zinc finger MYM-type protein 6-like n=1 Tax=Arctopsyche grandis TaxID=121162 RepID=UPI00406D6654
MKPSRLNEHFLKKHPDKNNKDILYFQELKKKFESRNTLSNVFKKISSRNEKGLMQEILSSVPLSNDTVSKRIDEMANDIEIQLCDELQSNEFSLQLDESTLRIMNLYYLLMFVSIENFFTEKKIPFTNVIACDTDGAPAMVGRHRGFISRLKNVAPNVLTIHCIIYRQHLVAKKLNGRLHKSLSIVIVVINKIKPHPLNDRLFRQLCKENDEEFQRLILHTEVRWLSKGNCLKRFYALFDTIVEFLDVNNENICIELKLLRNDVAYLSDIFGKINENLLKLQGSNISLFKAKGIILSFINKLKLFKNNLRRRELHQFPSLQQLKEDMLKDSDLKTYCSQIDALIEDMIIPFKDLYELLIPDWIINPFLSDVESVSQKLKEQFIELQNDCEAKIVFNQCDYDVFWVRFRHRYPLLWKEIKLSIVAFSSS